MRRREEDLTSASQHLFDVAIIGGGINGACLYHQLCREGRRVVLIEKGDFGSGTSQASAMMIWGGLLYLGSLDFKAVYDFSVSRDNMILNMADWVSPRSFRFLPTPKGKLSALPVGLALYMYWAISRFRRRRPKLERNFDQQKSMKHDGVSFLFEEGQLAQSDARFVLHWITQHASSSSVALNHCNLADGTYHEKDERWNLTAVDQINGTEIDIRAHTVVNCAGVWADKVNTTFGISSPYKHVMSKGVFLGLQSRNNGCDPLIMDMGEHNDVINSIPWGPVVLWGPTETAVSDIEEGMAVSPEDINFLLDNYNRCHKIKITKDDIISVRCGIRPLAVETSYTKDEYPLEVSRRHRIAVDSERSWVSVYGSKLTGCEQLAATVARRLAPLLPETRQKCPDRIAEQEPVAGTFDFLGLNNSFHEIRWCMEHEYCCTLEDYLRRRTNIAQWVAREGLGKNNEHEPAIRKLCLELTDGDEEAAERQFLAYQAKVENSFDQLLKNV